MILKLRIHAIALFLSLMCCMACNSDKQGTYRVLTAGIAHESNSFIPYLTTLEQFQLRRGEEALENRAWAKVLKESGMEVIPSLHASSGPSGLVSKDCYETLRDEILQALQNAGPVDGIFLDMHGAMHVEGYEDAQVDFIQQIRKIAGDKVLIAASFDLHGNISPDFIQGLNLMSAYRTAPHVDGEETRTRTARLLVEALRKDYSPRTAHINLPILIPGEKGITSVEPLKSLYENLTEISQMEGLMDASIFVGMPWTDVYRAGMSVQVVAENEKHYPLAQEQVELLANTLWKERSNLNFDVPTASIDEAIEQALEKDSTVFITDSGDNVTAGAAGDGTLVLARLLALQVDDAVLAAIVDPEAVDKCLEAGVGSEISLLVGGKIDNVFSSPVHVKGTVLRIRHMEEGSKEMAAILKVDGVTLVLLNWHTAFTDPVHFQKVDIDPLAHKIVVVKEGYLFPGLRDIAPHAIMALTPGFANQIMTKMEYNNVRRPIFPLDPEMSWEADQVRHPY